MSSATNPTATGVNVTASPHDPLAGRFQIAVEQCDVDDKKRLVRYRTHWTKWMSWYRYNTSEPHSIESQIHHMLFNDLTLSAAEKRWIFQPEQVSQNHMISAQTHGTHCNPQRTIHARINNPSCDGALVAILLASPSQVRAPVPPEPMRQRGSDEVRHTLG